jgi:quercetin dioxygenase-like cupin family protein
MPVLLREIGCAKVSESPIHKEDTMKALFRVSPGVLIGLISALTLSAAGDKTPVVWQAGDVKWTENASMKGLWVAPLWGDPTKEAYGALKKVAAGTDFGWHTHTFDQKVVSISGTFDFQAEGQTAKELASGSYVFVPGGVKHTAKCRAGTDCVYFEEQPGKSDFTPATPPAK